MMGEPPADEDLWGDGTGGNIRIIGILADTRGFLDPCAPSIRRACWKQLLVRMAEGCN